MKIENSKKKSLENSNESASAIDLSKAAWKDHKRPPCTISENYKKIITNFFLKWFSNPEIAYVFSRKVLSGCI